MTNPLEDRGLRWSGQEFHQLRFALEIFQLQTLDDFVRVTTFANSPFRNCPYPTQVFTARFADSFNLSPTS